MSNVEHPPSFDLRNFHGTLSLVFNLTFAEILLNQLSDEPVVEVDDDQCSIYIKFGDKLEDFVNGDEEMFQDECFSLHNFHGTLTLVYSKDFGRMLLTQLPKNPAELGDVEHRAYTAFRCQLENKTTGPHQRDDREAA